MVILIVHPSHACSMSVPAHPPLLNHTDNISQGEEMIQLIIAYLSLSLLLLLDLINLLRTLSINPSSALRARTKFHNHVIGKIIVLYCHDYRRGLDC
jgi:hypothetical protein